MTDATATTPLIEDSAGLPLPRGITAGKRFESLTVLRRLENDKANRVRLLCKCKCTNECLVRLSDLRSRHTKSCGCLRATSIKRRSGPVQLKRFGNFTALGTAYGTRDITPSTEWIVVCAYCPKVGSAKTYQLRARNKRCSCLKGTYSSWRNMIQRCTNPKHSQYQDYGGRGITVCTEWRDGFQQFVSDMGRRPKGKTLDRRDPNGRYTPQNCRWADANEQANNRR